MMELKISESEEKDYDVVVDVLTKHSQELWNMNERKLIGYTEREEGFYPMYAPKQGSNVTRAFILCKYCNGAIYHCMGPRYDAVCLTCYEKDPDER